MPTKAKRDRSITATDHPAKCTKNNHGDTPDEDSQKTTAVQSTKRVNENVVDKPDEDSQKTLTKSFLYWFFFWWCGFPHWYLGRTTHALLRMSTFGLFGFGALSDIFFMRTYVNEANGKWSQKMLGYSILDGISCITLSAYYEWMFQAAGDDAAAVLGTLVSAYLCLSTGRKKFDPYTVATTVSFRMVVFWGLVIFGLSQQEYTYLRFAIALCQSIRPKTDPISGKVGFLRKFIIFIFASMFLIAIGFTIEFETDSGKLSIGEGVTYVLKEGYRIFKTRTWEEIFDAASTALKGEEKYAYETLGLDSSATPSEVKKAWRSLVKKYHPDRAPEEPAETLAKINEAYDTLNKMYKLRGGKDNEDAQREDPSPSGGSSFTFTTHDSAADSRRTKNDNRKRGTRKTSPSDR